MIEQKRIAIFVLLIILSICLCKDVSAKTLRESSVIESSFSHDAIEEEEKLSTTNLQDTPQRRRKLNWFSSLVFEGKIIFYFKKISQYILTTKFLTLNTTMIHLSSLSSLSSWTTRTQMPT